MPLVLTGINGTVFSPAGTFKVGVPIDENVSLSSSLSMSAQASSTPVVDSVSFDAIEIPITIERGASGMSLSYDDWRGLVNVTFTPFRTVPHLIKAIHKGVDVQTYAYVTAIGPMPDNKWVFEALLRLPNPIWHAQIASPVQTASPLLVGGELPVRPFVTIIPTGVPIKWSRLVITEPTGNGLFNHPIRWVIDTTSLAAPAASDYVLFWNGAMIAFNVQGMNTPTTKFDFRVNVEPGSYAELYLVWGPGIDNQITANRYDHGGMDLTHASFSNTRWVYRSDFFSYLLTNPPIPGLWYLSRAFEENPFPNASFRSVITSSAFTVESRNDTQFTNDADAMMLSVPTGAAAVNALNNLKVTNSFGSPSSPHTSYIRYRIAGEHSWRDALAKITNASEEGDYSIPAAVQLALGGVAAGFPLDGLPWQSSAKFEVASTPPLWVDLDAATAPVLNASTPDDGMYVKGGIYNSVNGDAIIIDAFFIENYFIVDTLNLRIRQPSSVIIIGGSSVDAPILGSVTVQNGNSWFEVVPPSNAWSKSMAVGDVNVQFQWNERYF